MNGGSFLQGRDCFFATSGESVGTLTRLMDETSADLSDIKQGELDRKTKRQDTQDKTEGSHVLTTAVDEKTAREVILTVGAETMKTRTLQGLRELSWLMKSWFPSWRTVDSPRCVKCGVAEAQR